MFVQILIGTLIIILTVLEAGIFFWTAMRIVIRLGPWLVRPVHGIKMVVTMIVTVFWVQLAATCATWTWAAAFMALDLFPAWEPAVYFAFASFTTLGFGDVLLPQEWRLLSGMAASNGLLLFGLFTAFLVEVLRRIRDEQIKGLPDPE